MSSRGPCWSLQRPTWLLICTRACDCSTPKWQHAAVCYWSRLDSTMVRASFFRFLPSKSSLKCIVPLAALKDFLFVSGLFWAILANESRVSKSQLVQKRQWVVSYLTHNIPYIGQLGLQTSWPVGLQLNCEALVSYLCECHWPQFPLLYNNK